MKNFDELMSEWSKDAIIDQLDIKSELVKIPVLHAKYLKALTHHNLMAKKLLSDYNKLKKLKFEYFSGDLNNPEDLEKHNFEPLLNKVYKPQMQMYLDSDKDLINILNKKMIHEEMAKACEMILKELNSRTWQIRAFMDWHKYEEIR